ncbi:MAG TPA: TonB family protein [Candidatus Angelobacter sp.]|nr:TonB family protein [Candidatus Angelobacter sp.]
MLLLIRYKREYVRSLFISLLASASLHIVVLALIIVVVSRAPVFVPPPKLQTAQRISATVYLPVNPRRTRPQVRPVRIHRSPSQTAGNESGSVRDGVATQKLREEAGRATAEIITSIRFRQIYGFNRDHEYKLAVQTAGEIPSISPNQLPPRFEQYVIVEVTIDTEGHVAEARIVAGVVEPTIEQTLLSAIREFKYIPAKRDGVSIPSQTDIVIHIPT